MITKLSGIQVSIDITEKIIVRKLIATKRNKENKEGKLIRNKNN
jgi:hypothetical protein